MPKIFIDFRQLIVLKEREIPTISEQQIQILQNLGLTFLQAKCYLNLVLLRKADVKAIAKASSIARQDVYRIMSALAAKGLVEEIVGFKAIYKATRTKEGLSILMEKKKKECIDLEVLIKNAFNNFGQDAPKNGENRGDFQFELTSEISLLARTHTRLSNNARSSISFAIPFRMNEKVLGETLKNLKIPLRNCVKIRFIAFEIDKEKGCDYQKILAGQPVELRFVPVGTFKLGMHIFDKSEMTVSVSEKPLPSLWTNSPIIIELASAYFENMWNSAQKQ